MSTEQPHDPQQSAPTVARGRTPEQAAAWAKVERERAEAAARPGSAGVHPIVVARLVVGVLLAAAALTTFVVMTPDEPTPGDLDEVTVQQERADDRRDALLVIGIVGLGAAIATSGAERRTVERPS